MAWAELFGPAFLRDALLGLVTVALGLWLPGYFAFRHFRTGQWWEKKAGFYQEVVATLGNLKRLEDGALQDEIDGMERDEDERARAAWDHEETRQHLRRLTNEGAFLMSDDSHEAIRRYFRAIELARGKQSLREVLIERASVTNDVLMDVIAAAKKDLGVRK
ncbi:hypothetical protein [Rhodovulum euryhalinum]|uniref:Uncharacterized protein n=1 Tax=Rhodovulum euryhalinum TaxID=35805 RepID=A0A4R2L1D4_9RHOB|nr:hypothetical protein [Rhodovulum euryhalinum]TCO72835.1 hypothetical protein EV655_10363 [Rhodovulum euryhalinum]